VIVEVWIALMVSGVLLPLLEDAAYSGSVLRALLLIDALPLGGGVREVVTRFRLPTSSRSAPKGANSGHGRWWI
jgi:hypothetical protein